MCVLCFYTRVVTYSGHFVLRFHVRPFSVTFRTCFVVSADSRVCVYQPRVVTSSGHFDLRYFDNSVLTHLYSLQHPLLLMQSLSLFATCHPKKGCHWQSVFCHYKDRPPKGNSNSTSDRGHTLVRNEPCCCLQGKENSTRDRSQTRGPKEMGCCL